MSLDQARLLQTTTTTTNNKSYTDKKWLEELEYRKRKMLKGLDLFKKSYF